MSIENRKAPRRIVEHPAVILDHEGSLCCECRMMDVSATGAKLVWNVAGLTNKPDIPDKFILQLSKNGHVRRECSISWRSEIAVGVSFVK